MRKTFNKEPLIVPITVQEYCSKYYNEIRKKNKSFEMLEYQRNYYIRNKKKNKVEKKEFVHFSFEKNFKLNLNL